MTPSMFERYQSVSEFLVRKLRDAAGGNLDHAWLCNAAADEIERLHAELRVARKALPKSHVLANGPR